MYETKNKYPNRTGNPPKIKEGTNNKKRNL
jgi:hypothetical protein